MALILFSFVCKNHYKVDGIEVNTPVPALGSRFRCQVLRCLQRIQGEMRLMMGVVVILRDKP